MPNSNHPLDIHTFFREAIGLDPKREQHHLTRYVHSASWIMELLDTDEWRSFFASCFSPTDDNTTHILDVGGLSPFTAWLKTIFKVPGSVEITGGYDLRYRFELTESNRCQLITCMEVIEHIKDRDVKLGGMDWQDQLEALGMYTGDGVRSLLSELYRITKPGGYLFLTTPNVCSYRSIANILAGVHPFRYLPHVREYTAGETYLLVQQAGWQIQKFKTIEVWDRIPEEVRQRISDGLFDFFRPEGTLMQLEREDCTFLLARKPS